METKVLIRACFQDFLMNILQRRFDCKLDRFVLVKVKKNAIIYKLYNAKPQAGFEPPVPAATLVYMRASSFYQLRNQESHIRVLSEF